MLQFADEEVNDEWDDDFVFADEASIHNNDVSSEEGFDIDEDNYIGSKIREKAQQFENPYDDVGALGGIDDDIPLDAIGFDDISDDDEFDNDEPLALDLPVPNNVNRNSSSIQHLSMNSNSTHNHSVSSSKCSPSVSDNKLGFSSLKSRIPSGEMATQSVSSGTKSAAYDRFSTGSDSGMAKSTVDYGKQDEEEEEEDDDWNQDFMGIGHGAMSADDNRSIRQSHPFYLDTADVISAVPDKESLLDFLDSNVKRQVLEHSKIFRSSLAGAAICEDDGSELANHHLRGVFGWTNNVLDQLQSFCSDTARKTLNDDIWEETVQISPTEEFIHQTMDLCEQNPFRESNLYSLEIVAKWLSGYCVTTEFLQQSNIVIAERICIASLRGLGVLEAIKGKVNSKMMELVFVLKEEQNTLFQRFAPSVRDSSQGKVMERVFESIGLLATILRIQSRFTEVHLHLGLIDDYNAVLERIESALEFLDILVSYIEVVRLCIPLPSGEGFKTAQDYLRMGVKQEELIFRTKVTAMVKGALASNSYSSLFFHRFEDRHIQTVRDAVAEFSGMFLTLKLLFMSRISPLTLQPVVFRLLQQQLEVRRHLVPYNVAYDLPIGTQCKELMQRLESPSVVRARLSYALFQYIDCMLKRKLVWQADRQRGVFFKKRRGFMRRSDSDLAFGIDAADAFLNEDMPVSYVEDEITKSLSDSFGSSNELANQQLFLLLEVAVDLFPKTSASIRPGEKQSTTPGPFTHASFPMNFSINIIDNIKDPEKFWLLSRKDSRFASSFRSQMFHFSYAFVSDFAEVVHDQLPILSLELIRLQFTIFRCISGEEDDLFLLQKAFFLAVQIRKSSVAVHYGETLWTMLINQGAEAERVWYIGNLLASQYEEEAQYELAIRILSNTIMYIKNDSGRRPFKKYQLRIKEEKLDNIALRLSACFIRLGDACGGIKILQTLFTDLCNRSQITLFNDEKKIATLSWLLQAYTDLGDFDSSNRLIKAIKSIRQERLDSLYEQISMSQTGPRGTSAINLSEYASVSNSSSSINSMSGFLLAYGSRSGSNNVQSKSTAGTVGNNTITTEIGLLSSALNPKQIIVNAKAYRFQWNPTSSLLPQHCVTSHSMDLGKNLAEVYFNSGLFVSALNSLTPTIIGVEYAVRGKQGSRDGILELARLYYFRGKIQYEASRSARSIRFPFDVGSPEIFSAIQNLYISIPKVCVRGRSHVLFGSLQLQPHDHQNSSSSRLVSSELSTNPRMASEFNYTCKRSITYSEPADLLWDAMKWFRKAWDLFHTAGDEISAAKAANMIAKCHLLPCFSSFALLGVPIAEALDLSNFKPITTLSTNSSSSEAHHNRKNSTHQPLSSGSNDMDKSNKRNSKRFDFSKIIPPPPLKGSDRKNNNYYPPIPSGSSAPISPTGTVALNRFVSLEEVEKVSNFSLDIHIETSLPLGLMESYMNMAELFVLRGMKKDALLYWWEAKDLFLTLFADGCLLPILRRCSLAFMRKLKSLLDRIVAFLWISDYRKARDEHVFLLEIHNIFILEESRIVKSKGAKSRVVAVELQKLLATYLSKSASVSSLDRSAPRTNHQSLPNVATASAAPGSESRSDLPAEATSMPPVLTVTSAVRNRSVRGSSSTTRSRRGFLSSVLDILSCRSRSAIDTSIQERSQNTPLSIPSVAASSSVMSSTLRPTLSRDESYGALDISGHSASSKLQRQASISKPLSTAPNLPQRLPVWRHEVSEQILSRFLGKIIDMPMSHCCSLLTRGYVEEKLFDFNWSSLKFDRVYTNGKSQICSLFSSHVKQHVLTWVDLLGEDGLVQQQTNKFLPDVTWRKMQQKAPLNGLEDFGWLNSDFWHSTSSKLSNGGGKKDFDFQSFFDVACKYHKAESDRECERVGEDLIIERLWHLLLRLNNFCDNYSDKVSSLKTFSRQVRSTLLKYAGNMLRLRCFSKQFKFDIVNPSALNSLFRKLVPSRVGSMRSSAADDGSQGWLGLHPPSVMGSAEDAAVQSLFIFQQRMAKIVYVLHIGDLILLYNPHSGKDYKGQFGGNSARINLEASKSHSDQTTQSNGTNSIVSGGTGIATFRSAFPPEGLIPPGLLLNRGPPDFRLSNREVQLLFDMCSQEEDDRFGGGAVERYESFHSISRGALSAAISCLSNSFKNATQDMSYSTPSNARSSIHQHSGVFYGIGSDGSPSIVSEIPNRHSDNTLDLHRQGAVCNLRPISTQGNNGITAIPLTLLCSQTTTVIPWEALVPADVCVIRQLSVLVMFDQCLSNLCADDSNSLRAMSQSSSLRSGGFQKNLKPLFMTVSAYKNSNEKNSSESISVDVTGRIHNRRSRSGVFAITQLQHTSDYLSILTTPLIPASPVKTSSRGKLQLKKDRLLIQRLRHGLLPLPSLLSWKGHFSSLFAGGDLVTIPLNSSLDSLISKPPYVDSEHIKDFESEFDIGELIPSSSSVDKEFKDLQFEVSAFCCEFDRVVRGHVTRELQKRGSSESSIQFDTLTKLPVDKQLAVVVLTYCDLIEMNEATLSLLTTNRSSFLRNLKGFNISENISGTCCPIIIFAPSCVQERLVVELKLALDRWQRGDALHFATQSFDFSGGGSVYSRSSGRSSNHSSNMSPMGHNISGNSISANAHSSTPRSSSRWPSLRSRSASMDRLSGGSRGNNKSDPNLFALTSAHNSIGSHQGISIHAPNLIQHKDSGGISSFFHAKNRQSNDSLEPFSNLDRVDSGFLSDRNVVPPKPTLSSPSSLQDMQTIPGRIVRNGSGAVSQSRPGSGNSIILPPPPPPLSATAISSSDNFEGISNVVNGLSSSPRIPAGKEIETLSLSVEKSICDPCLIILQVVRKVQMEHAVCVSVYV